MAIRTVPKINNSSLAFGGSIYSISINAGYDGGPTKLTISIINETGVYSEPILNSSLVLTMGNNPTDPNYLIFRGIIFAYNDNNEQGGGQKILTIEVVDNSLFLDRTNVTMFKRGILGLAGVPFVKVKTIIVDSPNPSISTDGTGQIVVNPEKKSASVSRNLQRLNKSSFTIGSGGWIIVGEEQFPDDSCAIPDVKYNFSMLKSVANHLLDSMPDIQPLYLQTYEGTLRQVLQSWCADFGFSFYWDWSQDKLFFIDLRQGITNIPDVEECSVLSKKVSKTLEGTFKQYGVAVYAKPISKINDFSNSTTVYYPFQCPVFDVAYLTSDGNYGGGRTRRQFINSCILSYYNSALRKIYNSHFTLTDGLTSVVGITAKTSISQATAISILQAGFPNVYQSLAKFQNQYLVYLGIYDGSVESKWEQIEAEIASNYIGKYYRGLGTSNSSIRFCSDNLVYNYDYSASPQGVNFDGLQNGPVPFENLILSTKGHATVQPSNFKIFTASGAMSKSIEEFNLALGLENYNTDDLLSYNLINVPLEGANLGSIPDSIKTSLNLSDEQLRKYSLIITPLQSRVQANLQINFGSTRGQNLKESSISSVPQPISECQTKYFSLACKNAEQQARDIAFPNSNNVQPSPPPEGKTNKDGDGVTISLGGKSVVALAPSDANYQGVITQSTSIELLTTTDTIYKSFGDIGDGAGVAEIRVAIDNITDDYLTQSEIPNLSAADVQKAQTLSSSTPRHIIEYTTSDLQNNLPISVQRGLESLDVTVSDTGLSIQYTYGNKPPAPPQLDIRLRAVESRFNRTTFAAQ